MGHHVHIHTGIDGEFRCMLKVLCEAMGNHLSGRVPVGYDHSLPAPLVPEKVLKKKFVSC